MIRPTKSHITAVPDEAEEKTASGIFLTQQALEKPRTATVKAVGQAVSEIKPGDRIVYKSYSIHEVKIDKETYIMIAEDDVIGVVED